MGAGIEAVALGGTLDPVDARLCLAPEQFAAILADFGEARLADFYAAMFDDPAHLELFLANRPRHPARTAGRTRLPA